MAEHPVDDPVPEHPFTRAMRTWEAWSSADTWIRVIANARRHGRGLAALGDLDELTRGPDPLEALRANREVVERQELAARAMPGLGHLLRYDPRWRELADDNDADREC